MTYCTPSLDFPGGTFPRVADSREAEVLARITEDESGRNLYRPEHGKVIQLARLTGASLVIANLDRLARNAAFLLTLRDSGVRFLACNMPEANDLTVGIMTLVAQQEREAISRRTKEALAVAKARGVKLGKPDGAAALRRAGKGGVALRASVAANGTAFANDLAPVLAGIRAKGHVSLRAIAAELTARGISCLIPWFDGAILSQDWKEALWDRFVTGAPRPRTPSEQQYSDRKLRSRS